MIPYLLKPRYGMKPEKFGRYCNPDISMRKSGSYPGLNIELLHWYEINSAINCKVNLTD